MTCKRTWGSLTSKQVCAGAVGFDSCRGDSGGPLLYRSGPNAPWYLAGDSKILNNIAHKDNAMYTC